MAKPSCARVCQRLPPFSSPQPFPVNEGKIDSVQLLTFDYTAAQQRRVRTRIHQTTSTSTPTPLGTANTSNHPYHVVLTPYQVTVSLAASKGIAATSHSIPIKPTYHYSKSVPTSTCFTLLGQKRKTTKKEREGRKIP
ncbi:hypothetical protein ACJQWK_10310 [Exserohilum turcicum]